jgi:monovalent cation/proton antiporter MnhG/PhaG subunit
MSTTHVAVDALLALGTACQLVCCVGLLAARDAFDKLHYAGAASSLGPILILAAILVRHGLTAPGLASMVAVGMVVVLNPVVVHATAGAARRLEVGQVGPTDAERAATGP